LSHKIIISFGHEVDSILAHSIFALELPSLSVRSGH
jgi:hypothetical protein